MRPLSEAQFNLIQNWEINTHDFLRDCLYYLNPHPLREFDRLGLLGRRGGRAVEQGWLKWHQDAFQRGNLPTGRDDNNVFLRAHVRDEFLPEAVRSCPKLCTQLSAERRQAAYCHRISYNEPHPYRTLTFHDGATLTHRAKGSTGSMPLQ